MSRAAKIAGSATAMAAAVAFIGQWEGLRLQAYQDITGTWTVCYGETRGVGPGDEYSEAQCDAMLARGIAEFEAQLDACLAPPVPVPLESKIAFVSWTYNVGAGAACSSTLVRLANSGDLRGACDQLPRWNRAGGEVIRGLVNRRVSERALCHHGLDEAERPPPPAVIPDPGPQAPAATAPAWGTWGPLALLALGIAALILGRRR